ncbi:MAG TPA: class I SAM-dependent methyltransferase [Gemmatimonadales bacterium]|nr:class I SAM-dependent methyltransferase [Gemmatimonadales bacterium]
MTARPAHLGPEYASQFRDEAVVAAYHHRPAYSPGVVPVLHELLAHKPRVVLDLGCGTGDIARLLVGSVDRVDAVDISRRMVARGRFQPGGAHRRLNWLVAAAESLPLRGPYGFVTAGESLHWMEWSSVLPALQSLLVPGGLLGILGREEVASPRTTALLRAISDFSTNRDFRPYDLIQELAQRRLFRVTGACTTIPDVIRQPVTSYIESIHSRNGFSRDRMSPGAALEFDERVQELLRPYARNGTLEVKISTSITWGLPGHF